MKVALSASIGIGILLLFHSSLLAQGDSVYVRTKSQAMIVLGKNGTTVPYGLAGFPNRKEKEIKVTKVTEAAKSLTIPLASGKSVVIDVSTTPYKIWEIGIVTTGTEIGRTELLRYLAAQRKHSSTLAFDYLEEYKNGFFKDDALFLISVINAESQLTELSEAMRNESFYLAGDLALGLINNPGTPGFSEALMKTKNEQLTAVAAFYERTAALAMQDGHYQKAIDLYHKANQIAPSNDRSSKIKEADQIFRQKQYDRFIGHADSLERTGAITKTIQALKSASEIKKDPEVDARIERLDLLAQDSLYARAVKTDEKEDFIFYRKKGYYTYLNSYPRGKYAEPSESRIAKLNKEILKVNKFAVFYGWSTAGFKEETFFGKSAAGMTNIGIGRLTETRYIGLDFSFNQDLFQMNRLEDYGELDPSFDRIILTEDSNGKQNYTSAFHGSVSFAALGYKKNRLKIYAGGSVGWGQLTSWVHGYRYNIIKDKLPYDITGKTPHHYVYPTEELNSDLPSLSLLVLANYSNFLIKGSFSIFQPLIANVSVGYAF
jgi:tetratricopeptide (TPR) repeat protein